MRKKYPDKKRALSLIESAKRDLNYTLKIIVNEESANTIIRNIYESFRMLGEALLLNKGIEFSDHISSINELLKLKITSDRPINAIESLRRIRHSINYYGYRATTSEVFNIVSIAKTCFAPLLKEVLKIVNDNKQRDN